MIKNLIKKYYIFFLVISGLLGSQPLTSSPFAKTLAGMTPEAFYNERIDTAMQLQTISQQVQELQKILKNQEKQDAAKAFPGFTFKNQSTFAKYLVQVFNKLANQPLQVQVSIKALLQNAAESKGTIVSKAQRNYITTKMLSKLTHIAMAPIPPETQVVAKPIRVITAKDIQRAINKRQPKQKIKELLRLARLADDQEIAIVDRAAQTAFGQAIVKVSKLRNRKFRKLLKKLLKEAVTTPLLTEAQQNYVKKELLPKVRRKIKKSKRKSKKRRSKKIRKYRKR